MPSTGGAMPSVAVIGGGFAGLAAAHQLKRHGYSFTVFETEDGPGGTWRVNRFPGAEVDTPAPMYSFSFAPYDWSRSYPGQAELQSYLEHVADRFDLRAHFRFGRTVRRLVWEEDGQQWAVHLDTGEVRRFTAVVTAVGLLNVPNEPAWPGRELFTGDIFHTARWRPDVALDGRRVGVVGTGSTSAQIVAELGGRAGHLTVFQRQPAWVDPKVSLPFTEEERARRRHPVTRRLIRWRLFLELERKWLGGRIIRPGGTVDTRAVKVCQDYLEEVFGDHPDLKAALTPNSAYLGKRAIHSSTFYPTLLRDDVTLVPHAVERMTETGVVDAAGREHELDVVITATGFRAAEFLCSLEVRGRGGRDLREKWGDDPMAFLGIMVDEMPNLFMMYGPNTNYYAPVFNFEQQAKFVVRSLREMRRRGASAVEVRPEAVRRLNRWLKRRLDASSFAQAPNYFRSASGRVVTQWPDGASVYWLLTRTQHARAARFFRAPMAPASPDDRHVSVP
ncbi:flavin-containing monooxygenase [Streptosporangium sp. NPDC002607]